MTIEVDPYEALINLALADADLTAVVADRIDIWHHYGQDTGDWPQTAAGLIFIPVGGEMDREKETNKPVVEARCYADTPLECGQVWQALVKFTVEHNDRRVIATSVGDAFVYYVLPLEGEGMPRLQFDEDIRPNGGLPYFAVLLEAEIAHETVL